MQRYNFFFKLPNLFQTFLAYLYYFFLKSLKINAAFLQLFFGVLEIFLGVFGFFLDLLGLFGLGGPCGLGGLCGQWMLIYTSSGLQKEAADILYVVTAINPVPQD
jgi:hypothetical protein